MNETHLNSIYMSFSIMNYQLVLLLILSLTLSRYHVLSPVGTELKTLEWLISRLMLKLLVLLNPRLC